MDRRFVKISTTNIIVSGLSAEVSCDELRAICKEFGELQNITVIVDKNKNRIGFVHFGDATAARDAITELPKRPELGSNVSVDYAKERRLDPTNVYVESLPPKMTEPQLYEMFSAFGAVVSVRKIGDEKALIRMATEDSVEAVIKALPADAPPTPGAPQCKRSYLSKGNDLWRVKTMATGAAANGQTKPKLGGDATFSVGAGGVPMCNDVSGAQLYQHILQNQYLMAAAAAANASTPQQLLQPFPPQHTTPAAPSMGMYGYVSPLPLSPPINGMAAAAYGSLMYPPPVVPQSAVFYPTPVSLPQTSSAAITEALQVSAPSASFLAAAADTGFYSYASSGGGGGADMSPPGSISPPSHSSPLMYSYATMPPPPAFTALTSLPMPPPPQQQQVPPMMSGGDAMVLAAAAMSRGGLYPIRNM